MDKIVNEKSTLEELKAIAFDNLRDIERLQHQQQILIELINKKEQDPKVEQQKEEKK